MLLNEILRRMPGLSGGASAGRGRCSPTPIEIGPVTSFSTRLENEMFSKRERESQRSLIGQPHVSWMTQFETVMFSASPEPKRKTDHRVLNVQFVTVMNLQLPKSAQASSWHCTWQLLMVTNSLLMKWKPSLLPLTRL